MLYLLSMNDPIIKVFHF